MREKFRRKMVVNLIVTQASYLHLSRLWTTRESLTSVCVYVQWRHWCGRVWLTGWVLPLLLQMLTVHRPLWADWCWSRSGWRSSLSSICSEFYFDAPVKLQPLPSSTGCVDLSYCCTWSSSRQSASTSTSTRWTCARCGPPWSSRLLCRWAGLWSGRWRRRSVSDWRLTTAVAGAESRPRLQRWTVEQCWRCYASQSRPTSTPTSWRHRPSGQPSQLSTRMKSETCRRING